MTVFRLSASSTWALRENRGTSTAPPPPGSFTLHPTTAPRPCHPPCLCITNGAPARPWATCLSPASARPAIPTPASAGSRTAPGVGKGQRPGGSQQHQAHPRADANTTLPGHVQDLCPWPARRRLSRTGRRRTPRLPARCLGCARVRGVRRRWTARNRDPSYAASPANLQQRESHAPDGTSSFNDSGRCAGKQHAAQAKAGFQASRGLASPSALTCARAGSDSTDPGMPRHLTNDLSVSDALPKCAPPTQSTVPHPQDAISAVSVLRGKPTRRNTQRERPRRAIMSNPPSLQTSSAPGIYKQRDVARIPTYT